MDLILRHFESVTGMKYDLNRTTSTAQNSVSVTPRRFDWDFAKIPRIWCGNNNEVTHLMNTLSLVAPSFEDWAIPATRAVLEQIPNEALRGEARAFIGQEAHHSVAHKQFNREVLGEQHGLDVSRINRYIESIMDYASSLDEQQQIALAMAGEHFLTNIADWYLNDARANFDINAKADRLFAWHMAEEIEHTAVVYDVYDLVYGESVRARAIKYKMMLSVTQLVTRGLYRIWKDLMDQEAAYSGYPTNRSNLRNFVTVVRYVGKYTGRYVAYFSPTFHPWMHNRNKAALPGLLDYVQGS